MTTLVDALIANMESFLSWVAGGFNYAISDMIDVESVDDRTTLTMKDGSMLTMLKLHGTYRMTGADEYLFTQQRLHEVLKAFMMSGGHALHFWFSSDPDRAEEVIRSIQEQSRRTAEVLEMDLQDLFEEDAEYLSGFVSAETVLLTIITRPSALSRDEMRLEVADRNAFFKANPLPQFGDAQNLFAAKRVLRTRHQSFVDALEVELKELGLRYQRQSVHQAVFEQRKAVDPEYTDDNWRPVVPGDRIPRHVTGTQNLEGYLWPSLRRQIVPRDGIERDNKTLEIGGRVYAPMFIQYHPQDPKAFQVLFAKVAAMRIPWRISFLIESGGLAILGFKNLMNALVGWSSGDNGLYRDARDAVQDIVHKGEGIDVRYRVDLTTWAPKDNPKLLETRSAKLARGVQGWGVAEVYDNCGDPAQGFMATTPATMLNSPATISCAVLKDVLKMMPLYRPASPWDHGSVIFRTPDGKPWVYQPNSPVQSSWIALIYAEPRSGKSVIGNQINLGLCLAPGIDELPMICIIDVGTASSGLISLLENALPAHKRHQAASIRLQMTAKMGINPFDTQLGLRQPLSIEEAFLNNFSLLLCTPIGEQSPPDGMAGLVKAVIAKAYHYYADQQNPRAYQVNVDERVDAALAQYGINVDNRTTWWEVVDALFREGDYHAAMLAQRFAVPLLGDLPRIARDNSIQDMYGSKSTPSGEPLLNAFQRMITEAIAAYPILSVPTVFDIGDMRVISIDLDEVAKPGSAAADHQTGVCYMLARYIGARNFYLNEEMLPAIEPKYRAYHADRIKRIRQSKKHIHMDEFHRTKRQVAIRDQVIADMREGGKWGIMISLISQSVSDFDETMTDFATVKIMLSRANERIAEVMKRTFGLSDTVAFSIKNHIRPPSKAGSTFIGIFSTVDGEVVHLLQNTMGAQKLWAFQTSSEDKYVRDTLYGRFGPPEARKLLARYFPGGSIKQELEDRKLRISKTGILDDDAAKGVIDALVDDLVSWHERDRMALMQQRAKKTRGEGRVNA